MSADEIYQLIQPKIKRLNRTEKRKLYQKIFSEAHPAFKVIKRGKTRSLSEAKDKLERETHMAFLEERA